MKRDSGSGKTNGIFRCRFCGELRRECECGGEFDYLLQPDGEYHRRPASDLCESKCVGTITRTLRNKKTGELVDQLGGLVVELGDGRTEYLSFEVVISEGEPVVAIFYTTPGEDVPQEKIVGEYEFVECDDDERLVPRMGARQ